MLGNLNWVQLAWPMMAAACLTLGFIHAGVWLKQRRRWNHLLFAGAAFSVALVASFELSYMHAASLEQAVTLLRWGHLYVFLLAISLAGFAQFHFGSTRSWLLAAAVAARSLVLLLAILLPYGVNYRRVDSLAEVVLPGDVRITVVAGDASRWTLFASLSWLLVIALVADSAYAAWRRSSKPMRGRIALVGGSIVAFLLLAPLVSFLLHTGVVRIPYFITPIFCLVILAMAVDLTADIVRTSELSDGLRESEARLQVAERRFRTIVDSAPSAILIADSRGDITFANQQAANIFNYPSEELVGLTIEQLIPERLRAAHASHREQFAAQPSVRLMGVGLHLLGRRRDGSEFPIEVSLAPLQAPHGDQVVAIVSDITVRRQQELAAASQRAELTHLSRVAVLGELSASIAHEINQPLAAILSNAQAAQRYLAREPVDLELLREIIGDIAEDDKRAGEVIRRLRAMLRKEEMPRTALDLNDVARSVLHIAHSDLVNRGILVKTVLDGDSVLVTGDPVQLQQVLLNLILNACDAMSGCRPPRQLTLRTTRGGGEVRVEVTDRGTGIPEAELSRIFEPFVTTKPQGTGLGLSVCRTLVASHGGRIWAHNNPEGGATVTVALPATSRPPE